ncbi:MAG: hypothetical protein ACRDYD_06330 [Acidimicrobiales bacterium]
MSAAEPARSLAASLVAQARARARQRSSERHDGGGAASRGALSESERIEWLRAHRWPTLRFDPSSSPSTGAARNALRVRVARIAYTFLEPYLAEQRELGARLVDAVSELAESVDGLAERQQTLAARQADLASALAQAEERGGPEQRA